MYIAGCARRRTITYYSRSFRHGAFKLDHSVARRIGHTARYAVSVSFNASWLNRLWIGFSIIPLASRQVSVEIEVLQGRGRPWLVLDKSDVEG